MDNVRPELDLKYFDDICPDKNGTSNRNLMNWVQHESFFLVPVIAVFTKHDQFRRNLKIKLEDQHRGPALLDAEVESAFNQHYLAGLTGPPPFIRLESEDLPCHRIMYYTNLSFGNAQSRPTVQRSDQIDC